MRSTGGGQFGEIGQKLHEKYKIGISGSKQWRGDMGGQANFSGSGIPQFPSTRGNPGGKMPILNMSDAFLEYI